MKKITSNFLVILFTIVFIPFLSVAQVSPDLDNQDSLIHFLKMDKHPEYPEASGFFIHKITQQHIGEAAIGSTIDVAFKVIKVKDVQEYANIILPKFFKEIKLKGLKVTTYNLEHGKVQKTELHKRALQETKLGKELSIQLINAANVKDGSIVRYQLKYQGSAVFTKFNIQEALPVEYAAFEIKMPRNQKIDVEENVGTPFHKFTDKGYFQESKLESAYAVYFEDKSIVHSWARRKVPPAVNEFFTDDQELENVIFEFTEVDREQIRKEREDELSKMTWKDYNSDLYNHVYSSAFAENNYLYDLVAKIINKEKDSFTIARNLFKYVQDSFIVGNSDKVFDFETLVKEKQAHPAILNLFLCALYRHAGFHSDLIYVSTDRKNLLVPDKVREKNTAIAVRVILNGVAYLCNPAQKKLPFGYLPYRYYNGYTRLINKTGGSMALSPELIKNKYNIETELSPVDAANNKFKLRIKESFGMYGSIYERADYMEDSVSYKDLYKKYIQRLTPDLSIDSFNVKVENLDNIETSFTLIAEADVAFGNSTGLLFLDPFLQKVYNGENPFLKVKNRKADIKMDFCHNFNYTFRFRLSDDMKVEELPAKTSLQYASPAAIKYTQDASYNAATKTVEAKYNYDIIPVFYAPEEVADLSAFYTEIMKATNQKLLLNKQ